jgi:glycine amidinotransferase
MIVGDRMIETSCCLRNRYFENDLMKPILYDYFRRGARWICAPRPMMKEESFDRCYVEDRPSVPLPQHEIMFDAAQCLRFGRDILMNVRTENHELGFQWLQRELGDEFRLHRVSLVDNHLDGAMMPLRPGKMLICDKMYGKEHLLPPALQKWDLLHMLDEDRSRYSEEELLLASTRITVNVLSLDEERVLINEYATETRKLLEKQGFTPIPVRFRHSRIFGGGLHCVSLDVRRHEILEDYFA